MKKILFYVMGGENMCFTHVLLNALDLHAAGYEVKIVFEGQSVKLPGQLEEKKDAMYMEAKEKGLIAGVCQACATMLGVLDAVKETGLPLLNDMRGHAGIKPFADQGYETVEF